MQQNAAVVRNMIPAAKTCGQRIAAFSFGVLLAQFHSPPHAQHWKLIAGLDYKYRSLEGTQCQLVQSNLAWNAAIWLTGLLCGVQGPVGALCHEVLGP